LLLWGPSLGKELNRYTLVEPQEGS
jgi:hypothetical protein